jgi:hypothetical protein
MKILSPTILGPTTLSRGEEEKELARTHWGLVTFLATVILGGILLAWAAVAVADGLRGMMAGF